MPKRLRAFLDTSAILAGLNSPSGAAGVILAACAARRIAPIVSPQVIEEAERNIPAKFPALLTPWRAFLLLPPIVTLPPTIGEIRRAYRLLPTSDASILASALAAEPDAFVTWNTRDFMRREVMLRAPFPIFTPGQFLKKFRSVRSLSRP